MTPTDDVAAIVRAFSFELDDPATGLPVAVQGTGTAIPGSGGGSAIAFLHHDPLTSDSGIVWSVAPHPGAFVEVLAVEGPTNVALETVDNVNTPRLQLTHTTDAPDEINDARLVSGHARSGGDSDAYFSVTSAGDDAGVIAHAQGSGGSITAGLDAQVLGSNFPRAGLTAANVRAASVVVTAPPAASSQVAINGDLVTINNELVPLGWVAAGTGGAVGPIGAVETIISASSFFQAAGARKVKITADLTNTFTVNNDLMQYNIRRGSTIAGVLVAAFLRHVLVAGGLWTPVDLFAVDTPPAGNTQYIVTALRASGTGSCTTISNASSNNSILVEDIGS